MEFNRKILADAIATYGEQKQIDVALEETAIDIVPKAQPFEFKTDCNNCKHYESKQQLTLF